MNNRFIVQHKSFVTFGPSYYYPLVELYLNLLRYLIQVISALVIGVLWSVTKVSLLFSSPFFNFLFALFPFLPFPMSGGSGVRVGMGGAME